MLLSGVRTGFENGLAGRDERACVLQRGIVLLLCRRGDVRRLFDQRFLQVLRLLHALRDERLCLIVAFLHRLGGDLLELLRLFQCFVEEVHQVCLLLGIAAMDGQDPAQRACVLVELANRAAQPAEGGIGS